jgi:hypothetical protein
MTRGDRVKLSPVGADRNPDLAGQIGIVDLVDGPAVAVEFPDCERMWFKIEYVEPEDAPPPARGLFG